MAVVVLLAGLTAASQEVSAAEAESDLLRATPLAPRSSGGGEKLYETVDPAAIGIDFFHKWSRRSGQLRNNTTGCGVAIGDYDGDGLADVFLPRSTDGGRLYRNLGGFRFEDATSKAGILAVGDLWTTGATFVDIDNDGDLDLYVCGFDCPNTLYINNGEGAFTEKAKEFGLAFSGSSAMAAFEDFDRDGDLDLYLLTNHIPPDNEIEYRVTYDRRGVPHVPDRFREYHDTIRFPDGGYGIIESGQYDRLYRNDGEKGFTDVSEEAGIEGNHKGLGVVWWDYDSDGWPDIYVANDFYGPDRLYRNNRDGTFTDTAAEVLPHTPWFSMGCDSGDLNNDGLFDLIGTDMASDTHLRAKQTMGDIQDDGWFLESPTPRQYMRNAVYLNAGCERMQEVAYLTGMASTNWTWSVRMDDLDQDGNVDVHFTNGMSRDWGNSDLKMSAMKMGPMNSDAYNDYWDRQDTLREKNLAFQNLGGLRFRRVEADWGLDQEGVSFGAAFGDLDNDGDLDLVINNFNEMVTVCRNDGRQGGALRVKLIGRTSNRSGVGAVVRIKCGDVEMSRRLSLARGFMSSSDPTIHFGVGQATLIDELSVEWPSGHRQQFHQIGANQLVSVTEPASPPAAEREAPQEKAMFSRSAAIGGLLHLESEFDDFSTQPLLPVGLSRLGPGLACGDVSGNGADDLFLGGCRNLAGSILLNEKNGKWGMHGSGLFPVWSDPEGAREGLNALFFDADGDGDVDLYIVSGSIEAEPGDASLADALYLNDGSGEFSPAPDGALPDLRDSSAAIATVDFDRDGDLDLFVGGRCVPGQHPTTPNSRLLRNDGGRFVDATSESAPQLLRSGLVTSALWTDVNSDGWIDLLVTHEWGPVKVYVNQKGALRDRTAESGIAESKGWWNGIAGRDIDGDGDIDYVVSNVGANTEYQPSPERPAFLFYGDFNADGSKLAVEGVHTRDGQLVPTRSKPVLERAIPFIEAAYPTFAEYAAAPLSEMLGDEELAGAIKVEANAMHSVVLRNDGLGRFSIEPLPVLAQIAPGMGVVLNDFNGDGYTDCFIAQNCFSPRREIGRWDGGLSLLLSGDRKGNFSSVSPAASGLVVPGDARAAVATDFSGDGWPDLVVSVNSGEGLAFENRPPEGGRLATVKLSGPRGNPTAIGAMVTLRRSDGWTQTAEVSAGGGYLSQQPAALHFGLGAKGRVEAIEVRWPDGELVKYRPHADELLFELKR
ncbi:FG-GAP-like repeat-containing protein [Posidoniimonas corsicana]|uniref:FG-GAP-like repeat-containing protein n=1 Tax=Posidoniimonas corsicana TaxID=1938618 RepID=UPI001E574DF1|nr:FG-GAP-like repeat-containing protein [Posidoniimonas corsicana]